MTDEVNDFLHNVEVSKQEFAQRQAAREREFAQEADKGRPSGGELFGLLRA